MPVAVQHQDSGWIPSWDDEDQEQLMNEKRYAAQGYTEFADTQIVPGSGKGKLSLPYKSYLHFDSGAYTERQTTGDCTSHGARNAADVSRSVEIHIGGELESFIARGATEPIYMYRGFRGAGMSPARATNFLADYGFLVRQEYPFWNLSVYNPEKAIRGGGKPIPEQVAAECRKHPFQFTAQIRSVEQARDALANGYGLHCGSPAGFSNRRDANGISKRSGSWMHDMHWGGCDDTGKIANEMLFIIFNSWGRWNSGGHPYFGQLPDGAFIVREKDAAWMIARGECHAVGNFHGFPPQELPDYGTHEFL